VRFRVLVDGTVDSPPVSVQEYTDPGFNDAAVRVVNVMRFRPARVRRVPVPVWIVLPVTFRF
jgi:TonB family protein